MGKQLFESQCEHGVVPVIRTPSAKLASRAVDWLNDAGFRTFELSVSIKGVVDLVAEISDNVELDVGVGMVMNAEQAHTCIEAGASYIVTPGLVADVVAPCRNAGVACLLGVSTPSEVMEAIRLGADAVTIFPIGSLGGVLHLRALKAVFPDTPLVPAGGIGLEDITSYLKAGAAFVSVGNGIVDMKALCMGDKDAMIDTAASALEQVAGARVKPLGKTR